jgi:hypothetical protein
MTQDNYIFENNKGAKDKLIELLEHQISKLILMSKIELGNDVIIEILKLKSEINMEAINKDIENGNN